MSSITSQTVRLGLLALVSIAHVAYGYEEPDRVWVLHSERVENPLKDPRICSIKRDGVSTRSFPITHEPSCWQIPVPKPAGIVTQDFCVYTNSLFSDGRGISLITTPEVIGSMTAQTFYFEEERYESVDVPYENRQTSDRGVGLMAKKQFSPGDTYMTKTPILLVAKDALSGDSRETRLALLRKAIDQLPPKTQELYLGLSKSRGGDMYNDIFQTNSMGMRFEGVAHLGVVPEAARINHACRPNSYYRFDDLTMRFEVFALRNITTDEELSVSYGFSNLPHPQRSQAIEANWSFSCKCALCTAPEDGIQESNARLARIDEIKEALPSEPGRAPELIAFLPELINLLTEEGLMIERPQYEEILAYAWSAMGNEERAKSWAQRARLGWEIVAGLQSSEVRRMATLEQWTTRHPSWEMWKGVLEDDDHPLNQDYDHHDHDHDHDHED